MPLIAPNLDNRRFEDLLAEAKSLIPRYAPQWTDYNESDPGITLLELFSWLTELTIYRLNQVPDRNYIKFLRTDGHLAEACGSGARRSDVHAFEEERSHGHRPQGNAGCHRVAGLRSSGGL